MSPHAGRLGFGDALELPLATQVGFKLREHPQHVEEALAGGRAGVDRLLARLERCAARADLAYDVLQVTNAACQATRSAD
jgi:hypothetical protein